MRFLMLGTRLIPVTIIEKLDPSVIAATGSKF